jgi:Na+/proline symporter
VQLNQFDWLVVVATLVVTFLPVVFYVRRAGRGTAEFFASGRAAPWWLIGTSMVATTFSTDTPNLVTDFVRGAGVAKNWSWWAFLLTGMMTVFFYARLWRRSGVLTDLEFYELRYEGPSAAFLRGFRAIYLGLCFNCVIMATVTLAAVKIANVMLGWNAATTVIVCGLLCVAFGSFSGLWGVLTTDMLQFALAMVGVIAAAYYALQQPQVGGLAGLLEKIDPDVLAVVPPLTIPAAGGGTAINWEALVPLFIMPLAVQWWSVWYPGAEPGGGSYIAQRMLAARTEKDALAGTLWFNLAHYAIRPWPWILVALCSLLVFPTLDDIRQRFPNVDPKLIGNDMAYPAMLTLLPHGLLGLLVASLLAAYVSTMTTHMNWGASYLVNDFYRRFVNPAVSEHACVQLGRGVSALLVVVAGLLMFQLETAGRAFDLLLSIGAGTGLIYLLRWFWWRINAWSEIAAMAASFAAAVFLFLAPRWGISIPTHWGLVGAVAFTTAVWLAATYLTPPTSAATLERFYGLVRPAGPGWAAVRQAAGGAASPDHLGWAFLAWLLGIALVYAALFGVGALLLGPQAGGFVGLGVFVVCGVALIGLLRRLWRPLPKG